MISMLDSGSTVSTLSSLMEGIRPEATDWTCCRVPVRANSHLILDLRINGEEEHGLVCRIEVTIGPGEREMGFLHPAGPGVEKRIAAFTEVLLPLDIFTSGAEHFNERRVLGDSVKHLRTVSKVKILVDNVVSWCNRWPIHSFPSKSPDAEHQSKLVGD